MNLKELPIRLAIPAGHYVEQASALQCSQSLRERLDAATVVVALRPTGVQEVVWGHDHLMRLSARGQGMMKVLVLRVSDDEDYENLNSVVLHSKDPHGMLTKLRRVKASSAAQAAGASRLHPSWRLA